VDGRCKVCKFWGDVESPEAPSFFTELLIKVGFKWCAKNPPGGGWWPFGWVHPSFGCVLHETKEVPACSPLA